MTDTADLVKELDALHKQSASRDAPVRASSEYYHSFISGVYKAWPTILAALSSTQARADKLEAELAEAKREIERLRENHRVAVHRKRVTGEYRDDFKARAESAESSLAAARDAALEEAAKVAEGWESDKQDLNGDNYQTCGNGNFWDAGTNYDQGRQDAAARIRALKTEGKE